MTFSGQESKTVSPTVGLTPSQDITDSLASEILSFKTGTILDELEIRVRNKKHETLNKTSTVNQLTLPLHCDCDKVDIIYRYKEYS